jgi:hypothetical protein
MRNLRFNLGILSLIVLAVLFAGCSAGPVVKITGVEDGKVYGDAVTPGVAVDPEDAEVTLTLNGNPYDGSPITENGSYTLTAAATAEGVTQSQSVSFSIRKGVSNYVLFDDFEIFDGYSTENDASLAQTTNHNFVFKGNGALRVDKAGTDARSMVRLRDYHRNFRSDLSGFNRLGFWVYFPDASLLRPDAALHVVIWQSDGNKPTWAFTSDQFVDGWNYVEIDLTDPEKALSPNSIGLIEFQVRTADGGTQMTYYYDEIELWWQE